MLFNKFVGNTQVEGKRNRSWEERDGVCDSRSGKIATRPRRADAHVHVLISSLAQALETHNNNNIII